MFVTRLILPYQEFITVYGSRGDTLYYCVTLCMIMKYCVLFSLFYFLNLYQYFFVIAGNVFLRSYSRPQRKIISQKYYYSFMLSFFVLVIAYRKKKTKNCFNGYNSVYGKYCYLLLYKLQLCVYLPRC